MQKILKISVKIALLGSLYSVLIMMISGILISFGLEFPDMGIDEMDSLLQLLFAGMISSILATYISFRYFQLKKWHFVLIVFSILFLSNISVAIEGKLFTPDLITDSVFWTIFIQQFTVILLFSYGCLPVIKRDSKKVKSSFIHKNNDHTVLNLGLKLVLGGMFYMAMYYLWGWVNYNAFTRPFYELSISGLEVPPTLVLLKSIFVRGVLITLSIAPFLVFAKPDTKTKMYEVGAILFIFGGLLPLSLMISTFPLNFIGYSLLEILLQNFLTGIFIYKIYVADFKLPRAIAYK